MTGLSKKDLGLPFHRSENVTNRKPKKQILKKENHLDKQLISRKYNNYRRTEMHT